MTFESVTARFFRFMALQEINNNGRTSVAETSVLPADNGLKPLPPMRTLNRIPRLFICFAAAATTASLALASISEDLVREKPVPATEQVPILDFVRLPLLFQPELNLAGTHIAATINTADRKDTRLSTELMVYDLQTQKFERIGGHGDANVYGVRWLDSKKLVFDVGGTSLIAADAGSLFEAYPLVQFTGGYLIAVPPGDRLHPVMKLEAHGLNTGEYGEVVTLRTDKFRSEILEGYPAGEMHDVVRDDNAKHIVSHYPVLKTMEGRDYRYIADREGKLAFAFKADESGRRALYQLVGDAWRQCPEDLDQIEVLDAGDNPGELVVLGERKDGKPRPLEVMDAASGKVLNVLWQDPAYDFDGGLYRDPKSNRIVGIMGNKSGPFTMWFDESMHNLQKQLDKMFPGLVVRILGNDEAGKIFLVGTFSDRQPETYSWVDLEKRTAGLFKNPSPWIDPQRMQPMSVLRFKTRDGKHFDAYVTLPKGATKQNPPPLVVLPNGRSAWGFNIDAQFLASRGYAVLQPNHRGLSGYNWQYPEEDEWAYRKMHEDVTDATQTLIAAGLVDRNRVAILGFGDFNGYLALCGVAFEPSLYRCAVAVSPTCDYGRLMVDQKYFKYNSFYYDRRRLKLGDPKKDTAKFDAMSPLKHAGDIRGPVLIAEGEFGIEEGLAMSADLISAVKKNGVPAELVKFPNESDGLAGHLDHRVELYGRIETFLAKNLGGGAH